MHMDNYGWCSGNSPIFRSFAKSVSFVCSIVEINNQPITKEEDIASALRIKRTASVVVARIAKNPTPQALASTPVPAPKQPTVDVEAAVVEACKSLRTEHADEVESLHLLMQTLETQVREREKECQTLQSRMETYVITQTKKF